MPYFVEEGKSLTSKRGIRGPHDDVTERDIPGVTKERVEELVASGVLYEAEMSKPDAKAAADKRAKAAKAKKAEAKKSVAKKAEK
jgi:topoisomerase IA-like protein